MRSFERCEESFLTNILDPLHYLVCVFYRSYMPSLGREHVLLRCLAEALPCCRLVCLSYRKPYTRPETVPLMRDLFTRLYEKALKDTGGSVECSKALMGRGSAATTGVEGFYSVSDGVQIMHMFLLRPEGPVDVADMFLFCKVGREVGKQ